MIEAVLFDLDGLILDDETFTISSTIIEGTKYGYNITEDQVKHTLGLSEKESKQYFIELFGNDFPYDKLRIKRFDYIYDEMVKNGMPFKKGFHELFSFLKKEKIKMALVTSSRKEYIECYKKIDNFFDGFDFIVTKESVLNGKPHPDCYLKGAEGLNVKPGKCLVLEDSKNGILAGNKAGMQTIFIEDLIPVDEEIPEYFLF